MPYKDKEKQRRYQREWSRKNKESVNKRGRKWKERNREKTREYNRKYSRRLVSRIHKLLGEKCVYCGCDIPEALEVNHIYGKGQKELRSGRLKYYLSILSGRRSIDDLELTCRVCNNWHYLVKLKGIPNGWNITWSKPQDLNISKQI